MTGVLAMVSDRAVGLTATQAARLFGAAIAAASFGLLAAALGSQYIGGLDPCVLCIYQRWPHLAAGLLGLACVALAGRSGAPTLLLGLAAASLAVCAGIAFFHVGVEQHWWAGTASCGAQETGVISLSDLQSALDNPVVVRCDEPAWTLFGVSMAGYNMVISAWLAALALGGAVVVHRLAKLEAAQ